jgi:predicted dehydrogenase
MNGRKQQTRRTFLKKMTLTGAAVAGAPSIVPSSVLGLGDQVPPSDRVTLGCIGTGNQGTHDMKGFLQNADLQVMAVCDVNKGSDGYISWTGGRYYLGREPARDTVNNYYGAEKRSGRYKGCDAYNDFRDIIVRDDIDAVLIVTPDHWHAIPTIMAANAGKDIYCEKPLSLTLAEGQAMVKAVQKNGVIFQTGTHHRSTDQHLRFCCELVRNGRIGKLERIVTILRRHPRRKPIMNWSPMPVPAGFDYDMWLGPAPWAEYHDDRCLYNFRFNQDYSGGETTNTGAHCFDIVQWGNDSEDTGPVEFEDLGSEFPPEDALYNTVSKIHFRARYQNGVELLCVSHGDYLGGMAARFEGTEGWIEAGWTRYKTYPESLKQEMIGPNEIRLYRSVGHYRNFIDCVKSRRPTITPVEVGHRSTSVSHLANIAMLLKRKLYWDPVTEQFKNDQEANRLLGKPMRSPWRL